MTLETAAAFGFLAVVIVALSLLLNALDYFKPNNSARTNNNTNPSEPDQHESHSVAAAIASYNQDRNAQDYERASRERTTIRVLVGTGIFAATAAIVAFGSLIIFSQQVSDFRDQEHRQLRAYVYAKPPPNGVTEVVIGSTASTVIAIRNAGQTPAHNLQFRGNAGVGPWPLPPNQVWREGSYGGNMVLTPDTETTTGARIEVRRDIPVPQTELITANDIAAIRDGSSRRLYVFGTLIYDDVFKDRRYSNFCFAYYGDGPTLTTMDYCDQHNDAT